MGRKKTYLTNPNYDRNPLYQAQELDGGPLLAMPTHGVFFGTSVGIGTTKFQRDGVSSLLPISGTEVSRLQGVLICNADI